ARAGLPADRGLRPGQGLRRQDAHPVRRGRLRPLHRERGVEPLGRGARRRQLRLVRARPAGGRERVMARTEDRQGAVMDAQSALGFLAQASGLLAASLDYERTLSEVARLAVPGVADWCAIDILQRDGTTRQVTSVHPDPDAEALLLELRRRYRAEKQGSEGTGHVIATGQPELARDVTGQVAIDLDAGEVETYRRMSPRSYMIVPLVARGRTIGALTLLSLREGVHYT